VIPADELAAMAATAATALPDLGTIRRPTATDDGALGTTLTFAVLATSVPCRVRPEQTRIAESDVAGRLTAIQRWIITWPAGQDVTERDQITVGAHTYEVQHMEGGSWEITRRCRCLEIR